MSLESGEQPSFNFDSCAAQDYYNPQLVASDIVWPLVDHYWRGNWTRDSELNSRLNVLKGGMNKKDEYDVVLSAKNYFDEGAAFGILAEASIEVVSFAYEEDEHMIIAQALHSGIEVTKKLLKETEIKTSARYNFDSLGNLKIHTRQMIEDSEGFNIWSSDAKNNEYENDLESSTSGATYDKLYVPDMAKLAIAVHILAPKVIKQSFKNIKHDIKTPH